MKLKSKRISLFIPSFEKGGIENNVYLYSKILVENGYGVDLIYRRAVEQTFAKLDPKINKIQLGFNFNIPFIHPRLLDTINIFFSYFKYLIKNRQSLMVLSFQNNLIAIFLCKLLQIKVIVRIGSHPNVVIQENNWLISLSNNLKNIFYRYATLVITNSKITSNQISINTKAKVETIYNPAYSKDIIEYAKEVLNDSEFENLKGYKIISVGRLVNVKDFETLIKSFYRVLSTVDASLIIIGEGTNRNYLNDLIIQLGLEHKVYLAGFQTNPHKYVANSDLFVLSSKYEGLPNSLIEAIAVGTPAISTDCLSGPSEILLNGRGGDLVEVGNIEEMAEAIIRNLTNQEYAKAKHKTAFINLYRFSYENVQNDILRLIKNNYE